MYQTVQGPYSEVGPHFQKVVNFLNENDMNHVSTAGMYYDDPETTSNPRSAVGFLVGPPNENEWNQVPEHEKRKWKVMVMKETDTIVSLFPMKWMAVSCALSAIKTYPAFKKQKELFASMKSGTVEIYNSSERIIETHFPQNNFDQFCPKPSDWSTKAD